MSSEMVGVASPELEVPHVPNAARFVEDYYDPEFDEIVAFAADICGAPMAAIMIVGDGNNCCLSRYGNNDKLFKAQDAISSLNMACEDEVYVITDPKRDPRSNKIVGGSHPLRFYAGALFTAPDGEPIGTLSVMDTKYRPHGLTPLQDRALRVLARKVATHIIIKKNTRALKALIGLQQQDRLWRLSSDLMIVCGLDGVILAANPAWTNILGWSPSQLIDTSFTTMLHGDDLEATSSIMNRLGAGGTISGFENRFRAADGSYRTIAWNAVPDASGIYGIGRDITPQRTAETALATSQEALNQSQKMEAVGQLTGGIAHDFRNLLATIVVNLDMLAERVSAHNFNNSNHFVSIAQKAATRACALTERLMAFSHKREIAPKPTKISKLVYGMEDLLQRAAGSAIRLRVEAAEQDWIAVIDGGEFENVLLNLVINARDALVNQGSITIKIENQVIDQNRALAIKLKPGRHICISVTDDGPGMPPDVIEHALEPFFTTKPVGSGTGLGLFMVNSFALKWGGAVTIDSKMGSGTSIRILLPEKITRPETE